MYKPLFHFKYDPCYDLEEKTKNIESQNYQIQSLEAPVQPKYYNQPEYNHFPKSSTNNILWFWVALLTVILGIIAYANKDFINKFLLELKEIIRPKKHEEQVLHTQEIDETSLKQLLEPKDEPLNPTIK